MKRLLLFALLFGSVLTGFHYTSFQAPPEFEVPEGFAVEEVYSPEEASTVIALTFDSQGRLVISREDSSIVRLFDEDEDGVFEEEQLVTDQVTNSQGMVFDGSDLLAVGNGPKEGDEDSGLYRVVDEDGDGEGDRVAVVTRAIDGMQEHGPHHPFFGPDGYLYWATGNHTTIRPPPAPLSPLNDYVEGVLALTRPDPRGHANEIRAPGGKFFRKNLQESNSSWELVVGGFRNQYDGAFNLMGELFTFDSDMEWDRDLPWFRPVRTVHAVPGGDYGWRTGSRKLPPYYIDTLPPTANEDRGSPTGVAFYRAYSYPEEYQGMFLQGDWSRGRILMSKLQRDGATYSVSSSGEFVYGEPLNVTDLAVGPDGNVYFSLGGRNTTGGIYRVVYNGPDAMTRPEANGPIEEVLTMPQPRSAWSRQRAREIKAEMGASDWQEGLMAVATDAQARPKRRVRALELLQVFGPDLSADRLMELSDDDAWEMRAASTYYLGLHKTGEARRALAERLGDEDPFVQRRAAEALLRTGVHPPMEAPVSATNDVFPLLSSEDRFVRYAGRTLLRRMNRNSWRQAALQADEYPQAAEALMAYVQTIDNPNTFDVRTLLRRELDLLREDPSNDELIQLIRVMQRTMLEDQGVRSFMDDSEDEENEVTIYRQMGNILLERFPAADSSLNREIARTLVYLEQPGAVDKLIAELDNPDIGRGQQIFYAYALSNLSVGWDESSADRLVSWFEKVDQEGWRGGASFSGYLRHMREDFLANADVPEEYLATASERLAALEEQEAASIPAGGPAESPHDLSDQELAEELIYDPQSFDGDPAAGAVAYQKALCSTCHTFGPLGREFGPDLTTVGQRFARSDLVQSIIYPSRTISDQWDVRKITTTEGSVVSGFIYNENAQEVVVQLPGGGLKTIPKANIESRSKATKSAMPEGLHHYLTQDELVDLLSFLETGPEAIPDSLR